MLLSNASLRPTKTDGSLSRHKWPLYSRQSLPWKANLIVRGLELRDGDREAISGRIRWLYDDHWLAATNLGLAMEEIRKMLTWRLSDEPVKETDSAERRDPAFRAEKKCTIFCHSRAI